MDPSDDLAELREALMAQSWVFLLEPPEPVFAYDPTLSAVIGDALLLTQITDDQLSLPALPPREASTWLRKADTLTELRAAAHRPPEVRKALSRAGRP